MYYPYFMGIHLKYFYLRHIICNTSIFYISVEHMKVLRIL